MTRVMTYGSVLAACLIATAAFAQQAGASKRSANQCFRSQDYQSFRPIDDHAFNIRVGVRDYYRIEVEGACPELTQPDAFLITTVRGSDEICGPLDWDLKIGQSGPGNIAVACIVKRQTKLTPAEAAAIPPRQKP